LLRVDNVGLIGQRGLEIRRRFGEIEHPVELPANLPGLLDHIELEAHRRIHPYGKIHIENRGFALTLRLIVADEPDAKDATSKFVRVIREFDSGGQLEVLYCGDRVEARVAGWHKGDAVSHILKDADPLEALAIYLGDDVTDEDAFEALRHWSEQEDSLPPWIMTSDDDEDAPNALPILVADRPRPTVAPLFVRGSDEVYEFLCSLAAISSTLL
jgi:trehalose-phosphatase